MNIKVLGQLGSDEDKALLLELPKKLAEGLTIAKDGSVNTKELLGLLMMIEQEEGAEATHKIIDEALAALEQNTNATKPSKSLSHAKLMHNIFDPNCAADVSYSSPLKQ